MLNLHHFKQRSLIALIGLTLYSPITFANTETPILSPHDGKSPYLVVTEDKVGSSKREPGIYTINEKGDWSLAIKGRPNSSGATKGILAQFATTKSDSRYLSLVAVDGRLALIDTHSDAGNPKTFVDLANPTMPIIDMNSIEVQLPKVSSLQEINYYTSALRNNQELVLVSLKSQSGIGQGGITLAFVTKTADGKAGFHPYLNQPVVIDYRFHSQTDLAKLSIGEMDGDFAKTDLFSEIEIKRLVRKYKPLANPTLAAWVQNIEEAIKPGSSVDYEQMPYLDLLTGEIKLKVKPMTEVTEGETTIRQYFDVLNGLDSVIITHCNDDDSCDTELGEDAKKIPGKLNLTKENKNVIFTQGYTNNHEYIDGSMLLYINNDLYLNLAIQTEDEILPSELVKIETSHATLPTKMGYAVIADVEQSENKIRNRSKITLLYSREDGKSPGTYAVSIQVIGQGQQIVAQTKISDEFFTTSELESRIKLVTSEQDGISRISTVLLDTLTEHYDSNGEYLQELDKYQPYYNVTQALSGLGNVYQHTTPVKTIEVLGKNIKYLEYKQFSEVPNDPSGIYLYDGKEIQQEFQPAQILTVGKENKAAFARRKININGANAIVTAFGSDQSKKNGSKNFLINIAITPNSSSGDKVDAKPAILVSENYGIPFDQFDYAQLMQGTKKYKDHLFLFLGWKKKDGAKNHPTGGVYLLTYKLNATTPSGSTEMLITNEGRIGAHQISTTEIPADAISSRVRLNTDGMPYWVKTPDVMDNAPEYEVLEALSGNIYHPNRGDKIDLASQQDSKKAVTGFDESSGGYDEYSFFGGDSDYSRKWRYTIIGSNANNLPALQNISSRYMMSDAEKAEELKIHQRLKSEFPELPQFLESLVAPETPNGMRVIVVSKELKQDLLGYIRIHIDNPMKKNYKMTDMNSNLIFSVADLNTQDQKGIVDLYDDMKKQVNKGKISIVFADAANVMSLGRPHINEEKKTDLKLSIKDGSTEKKITPHLLYLMKTEGGKFQPDQLDAFKPQMQQVLIATPDEFEHLKSDASYEMKVGLLDRVEIRAQELYSPFKFWPVAASGTNKGSSEIAQIHERPMSPAEQALFPDLRETLTDLADLNKAPKHSVLIVPKDLKRLVRTMILSYWDSGDKKELFSAQNNKLEFAELIPKSQTEEQMNQADLMQMLETLGMISRDGNKRSLAIGDLETLMRFAKPQVKNTQTHPLMISDEVGGANAFPVDPEAQLTSNAQLPHLLYLLEAEGKHIQPKELLSGEGKKPEISMLLVGTEEEWDRLNAGLEIEKRYGLTQRFETHTLSVPTLTRREKLLDDVLNSSSIKSLGYRFDPKGMPKAENMTADEARANLIGMLVNKAEVLSGSMKIESTSAFITILDEFTQLLTRDPAMRQAKVIDRTVVERLLSKVFNIPLNLNILPKNDPLVILSDPNAALKLQEAGYEGPLDLKYQVIDALLAQTRHDDTRAIPSSIMLFGGTGSGKTFLFEVLCKMMGVKMYDFSNPNDESAGAIIIKSNNLTLEKNEGSGLMSVDEALGHVNNLMSLPNGYRAHIMFDDLHKASEDVRQKIIEFMQSLLEAKGKFRVKSAGGVSKDIPTRNLNLWTTLNPTEDTSKLGRFGNDDIGKIIATLNTEKFQLERSFFQRWNLILNLSTFPSEAKAPKLLDNLRNAARSDFNVQNRLILVSPDAVAETVSAFKKASAREFLSAATSQFLQVPPHLAQNPFFIVVPKRTGFAVNTNNAFGEASGRESRQIEDFVLRNSEAIPVGVRIDGQVSFLKFMVDGFRTRVMENLVNAIQSDARFAGSHTQTKTFLAPALHALTAHYAYVPTLPISQTSIDPRQLGITSASQMNELQRALYNVQLRERSGRYAVSLTGDFDDEHLYESLINSEVQNVSSRSRVDVVNEVSERIRKDLTEYLQAEMRVGSLMTLPKTEEWARAITAGDSAEIQRTLGKKLTNSLMYLLENIWSEDLYEQMRPEQFKSPSIYDAIRLFNIALDREIGKLPWSRVTYFMVRSLTEGASSMAISQLPGFQHYLFSSKISLIKAASPEGIFHMASNLPAYRDWKDDVRTRLDQSFIQDCNKILRQR